MSFGFETLGSLFLEELVKERLFIAKFLEVHLSVCMLL